MRLELVENAKEKESLYAKFLSGLRKAWPHESPNRTAAFPSGKKDGVSVIHNNRWGLAAWKDEIGTSKEAFKSYFCPYEKSGNLQTVLEINISVKSQRRAGFFARHKAGGACFLMHSGRINIQEHPVTEKQFLDWLESRGKPVKEASSRRGLVIAQLDSGTIGDDIAEFIGTVTKFKSAVRAGKVKL